MKTLKQQGYIAWIILAALVVIAIIAVNVANDNETDQSGDQCWTKCSWFTERVCGTNEKIGLCFFSWGCGDGQPCGEID